MKKSILAIAAACAAAACLCACNSSCGGDEAKTDYAALNAKLGLNYSQIDITVTDTFDENTSLVSTYTLKYADSGMTVSYKVERFNDISLDNPSTELKTTITGEAVFENGALVSGDVTIAADIPTTGLNFKEEYFQNATFTGKSFKADVSDASGFIGSALVCTEMKVVANYANGFSDIKITYKAKGGNAVEYKYVFKG